MSSERDDILPANQLPGKPPEGVTERAPSAYPVERTPLPAPAGRRRYSTLFAWLFVAFVVVIAVGLVLPAVEHVRGAAGRMSCSNNLKQIALAIRNHAATYDSRLPPQSCDQPGIGPASFFFTLFPYMESSPIYWRATGTGACWNAGNSSTAIKPYICPGDTSHANGLAPNGWAVTSYSTNALLFASSVSTDPMTGKERCHARYKIDNIPDGTSNTIGIVERYSVIPKSGHTSLWAAPCGGSWGWPETSHAYGMWSTGPPELGVTPEQARYDVPNSGHKAVLVAMMDGSVRAIGHQVGAANWLNALAPDDGPLLDGPCDNWE
jgi:hypothetical protein